jgi:hypothetical protein
MKPTIQFFRASTGALFARIATTARDLTIAVEATDEQAVRQEAADMRARAARLIDRAEFIEASLAPFAEVSDFAAHRAVRYSIKAA